MTEIPEKRPVGRPPKTDKKEDDFIRIRLEPEVKRKLIIWAANSKRTIYAQAALVLETLFEEDKKAWIAVLEDYQKAMIKAGEKE